MLLCYNYTKHISRRRVQANIFESIGDILHSVLVCLLSDCSLHQVNIVFLVITCYCVSN